VTRNRVADSIAFISCFHPHPASIAVMRTIQNLMDEVQLTQRFSFRPNKSKSTGQMTGREASFVQPLLPSPSVLNGWMACAPHSSWKMDRHLHLIGPLENLLISVTSKRTMSLDRKTVGTTSETSPKHSTGCYHSSFPVSKT
jgi:hypothetical protein